MNYLTVTLDSLVLVSNYVRNLIAMLKRRTSKRFVIGDSEEGQPSWEKEGEDEATEAIPNNLLQKFQMTLDAEPEGKSREQSPERRGSIQDGTRSGLLRPPASTSTLQ